MLCTHLALRGGAGALPSAVDGPLLALRYGCIECLDPVTMCPVLEESSKHGIDVEDRAAWDRIEQGQHQQGNPDTLSLSACMHASMHATMATFLVWF